MKNKGFTLLELLVVMAIIGILAGMLLSVIVKVRDTAKREKARDIAIQVVTAWQSYLSDYRQFPTTNNAVVVFTEMDTNACNVLAGRTYNTRGTGVYMEFTTNEMSAAITGGLRDPWGERYRLVLDTDYDGKVQVNGTVVLKDLAVWSKGPDKTDYTTDDITIWDK